MSHAPINADDLSAHIDGRLDAARAAAVAAYLAEHPEAAGQVAADRSLRTELRAALAPVAAGPMPPELHLSTLVADRRARRAPHCGRAAALTLVCLGVGAASGWMARGLALPPTTGVAALGREAAYSYRTYVSDAQAPVDVASADRLRLASWISGPLRRPVNLPDLSQAGFQPTGGRLVATPHGPAGLFLYRGRAGAEIAVFIRPMDVELNASPVRQDLSDARGVVWADRGMGYGVVGGQNAGPLMPIVDEMRRQTLRST